MTELRYCGSKRKSGITYTRPMVQHCGGSRNAGTAGTGTQRGVLSAAMTAQVAWLVLSRMWKRQKQIARYRTDDRHPDDLPRLRRDPVRRLARAAQRP